MSALEGMTLRGYSCDGHHCPNHISGETMPYFEGVDHYRALARAAGWTFWASRSLRSYCPYHGPSKGTKLREVTR